jgi:hypothetical protein
MRLWIVLSVIWLLFDVCTALWSAADKKQRSETELAQATETAKNRCRGTFMGHDDMDLSTASLDEVTSMQEGLRLMKQPNVFDKFDAPSTEKPKTWAHVVTSDVYQKFSVADRAAVAQQYFKDVVRPHFADPTLASAAQAVFLAPGYADPPAVPNASHALSLEQVKAMTDPSAEAYRLVATCRMAMVAVDQANAGPNYDSLLLGTLLLGAVPPVVTLVAGLAFAWVFAGFRKHGL